jgi:hypothetical protein
MSIEAAISQVRRKIAAASNPQERFHWLLILAIMEGKKAESST